MIYNPVEIIRKKRQGEALSTEEIKYFIGGAVKKEIPDYQVSAFLMAAYFRGMEPAETATFTKMMMESGKQVKFRDTKPKVDKHSTGGVGDKVSLILAPLVASLGVDVPMVSGRGLGHTGGTLDKLESIAGFSTHHSTEKFIELVEKHGVAMMGQSEDFVPADKIFYALRDVTATVESIPLITGSILSKKAAEGISGLVMDIKVGQGAFMETVKDATLLANSIVTVGTKLGLKVRVVITDMSQPLGYAVGHSLEVLECIDVMKGNGPDDLRKVTLELASHMLVLGKKAKTLAQGKAYAIKALDCGMALKKFSEMCLAHGAKFDPVTNPEKLHLSDHTFELCSETRGFLHSIDTRKLGMMLVDMGGGRKRTTDKVDFSVGYVLHKKIGDQIMIDESIMRVYFNPENLRKNSLRLDTLKKNLISTFRVSKSKVRKPKLIVKNIQ